MPGATLGVAETLPPVFDAIGFLGNVAVMFFVRGLAERLMAQLETLDIIGRLNKE